MMVDEDSTIRLVSRNDSAGDVFKEQQDSTKRKLALVLEVPHGFGSTQDALEWVKEIKKLEQEAYKKAISKEKQPSVCVCYDYWKTLPCLLVLAPDLKEISDLSRRKEEEKVRANLAEEGAIVFERTDKEGGGSHDIDDFRKTINRCYNPSRSHKMTKRHGPTT